MADCEPWYVRVGRPLVFTAFRFGAWRLFGHYTGDSSTMGLLDQAFWAYKRDHPLAGRRGARTLLADALPPGRHRVAESTAAEMTTVTFVGDVMPLGPFCDGLPLIEVGTDAAAALRCDVLFANLEGPVGDSAEPGSGGGLLGSAPRLAMGDSELAAHLEYLRDEAGHLVLSTANNHAWDLGAEGIGRTLHALRSRGVVGVGTWATADSPADFVAFAAGKHRIGVVPFTFGTNGLDGPPEQAPMVNVAGLNDRDTRAAGDRLVAAVGAARAAGCDLVVTSLHWGLEFEWYPTEQQIHLARRLVDAGADIVWGHHPHVIQPVEVHRRRDGTGAGVVIYSAGNLVTPILSSHTRLSLAVRLGVAPGADGLLVREVDLIPLVLSAGPEADQYRIDTVAAMPDRSSAATIEEHLRATVPRMT